MQLTHLVTQNPPQKGEDSRPQHRKKKTTCSEVVTTHDHRRTIKTTMENQVGTDVLLDISKNPLLCPICHDYFTEPCILNCYHTFCARCLRNKESDSRYTCPLCGHQTQLKDGSSLPPPDTLMRQLIDIANSENPPCANCDKRDRSNMYYCSTCQQALCVKCRDNTHRAKMFSSHSVVHTTKVNREPRRCPQHGEHYIMYSPLQHMMLCMNCFKDVHPEMRSQCIDMDTAHSQAIKRLERGQNAIMDLQSSVRDGLIALKGLLDELRRNMEAETGRVNAFCQGMQEAMAKTHATMIMEVQRQFEGKERAYRKQLVALGTVMPVLQLHLVLCTTFTQAANKYQFLELCPAIIERLAAVGQLSQPIRNLQSSTIRTNYRSEFAQCLEPWVGKTTAAGQKLYDTNLSGTSATQKGRHSSSKSSGGSKSPGGDSEPQSQIAQSQSNQTFSIHCRTFDEQLRSLSQQLNAVKERIGELHRDVSALRKAQTPPLMIRYESITRDCIKLDQSLERQQEELDRLAQIFDTNWEEQLWNLRVEQEMFNCQRTDILTLRNELKHLSTMTTQLEPYIRTIAESADEEKKQISTLLDHFGRLHVGGSSSGQGEMKRSRSRVLGQLLEKVRPVAGQMERSKSVGQTSAEQKSSSLFSSAPVKGTSASAAAAAQQAAVNQQQQQTIERLESQLKEKLHDLMYRRQSSQGKQQQDPEPITKLSKSDLDQLAKLTTMHTMTHMRGKRIGAAKSCDKLTGGSSTPHHHSSGDRDGNKRPKCPSDPDYQRISDTTSHTTTTHKALVHKVHSSPSSPKRCRGAPSSGGTTASTTPSHHKKEHAKRKHTKVYPYSDGEDNVFYSRNDSVESLSTNTSGVNSRRSSIECAPDKTLVVVIGTRKKQMSLAQKQRSWETFPPKRKHHHVCHKLSVPSPVPLKKADSFEGHEEAVKTLVAAVQETRRGKAKTPTNVS